MEELETKLNYRFRDRNLLEQALCHSSYANEHRASRIQSNERLEFLGDSVLGFVTAEFLYLRYPDWPEGKLTPIRAALVCEESLHETAKWLELGRYLRLGRGEEGSGGRQRPSILADAVEALIAAVYLDGGMEPASALIHRCLLDDKKLDGLLGDRIQDYKTALQELIQSQSDQVMAYRILNEQGPDHAKVFTAEVLVNGRSVGQGSGRSKKEAEQSAARAALMELMKEEKKN